MCSRHATAAEVCNDGLENTRRSRNVEQALHVPSELRFDRIDLSSERLESIRLIVTASMVGHVAANALPDLLVQRTTRKLVDRLVHDSTELLVLDWFAAIANQMEISRKEVIHPKVKNSWNELARSQVTGSSEDHHYRRRCPAVFAQALQKGMPRFVDLVSHENRPSAE